MKTSDTLIENHYSQHCPDCGAKSENGLPSCDCDEKYWQCGQCLRSNSGEECSCGAKKGWAIDLDLIHWEIIKEQTDNCDIHMIAMNSSGIVTAFIYCYNSGDFTELVLDGLENLLPEKKRILWRDV